MGAFIRKVLILSSPLVLVYLVALFFFLSTGELESNRNFFAKDQYNQFIYLGLSYSQADRYYKNFGFNQQQPEVIALGSSRVLQFRKEFFKQGNFFNVGRTIRTVRIPSGSLPQASVTAKRPVPGTGLESAKGLPASLSAAYYGTMVHMSLLR